jgi:PKD repeat protein
MKTIFLLLVCSAAVMGGARSQGIAEAEYFFDADPGCGHGVPVVVTLPGDTVDQPLSISTAGLSMGPHQFCLRTRDAAGTWSLQIARSFFVNAPAPAAALVLAEYFFDADPGQGNGIPVFVTLPGDTVDQPLSIPTAGLSMGPHLFCLRTRDAAGTWSLQFARSFFVSEPAAAAGPLTAAEYFFDADPGQGNGTPLAVQAGDSVLSVPPIVNPFAAGSHYVAIRTRNATGTWSLQAADTFTVCSTYGAKSEFDYFVDRKTVYFSNRSEYDTAFQWSFGDATSTTVQRNPAHVYPAAGNFTVSLVSQNGCATDTKTGVVAVPGLQSISPAYSADTNLFTAYIRGYGFQPGCAIRLQRPGVPDILADTTVFGTSTSVAVIFKFRHNPAGPYNVIAENPGGAILDTLYGAFRLESQVRHDLGLAFAGSTRIRTGRSGTGRFSLTNNGNTTLVLVPFIIYFTADSTYQVVNLTNLNTDPTVPASISALIPPGHAYNVDDPANPTAPGLRMIAGVIPELGPGETQDFSFSSRSNVPGCTKVKMKIGEPLDDWKLNPFSNSCNFMPKGARCMMDLLGMVPVASCAVGVAGWLCAFNNAVSSYAETGRTGDKKWDLVASSATTALACVPGVSNAAAAIEIGASIAGNIANAGAFKADCMSGPVDSRPEMEVEICFGNSYDPNEKTGPHGVTADNYINKNAEVVYTVKFENLDTATAPAAVVQVSDVLDTSLFDLSTFSFRNFALADSVVPIPDEFRTNYVHDFDLRSTRGIWLRAEGRMDTSVGRMDWHFTSLDTVSMDVVTNPSLGFLPPNVSAPEGEGFISFSVRPKPTLQHLQVISNTSSITFDNNTPISTNTWINTIDTVKPASAVLPLSPGQTDTVFTVVTNGSDAESGILDYILYVSANDSDFKSLYIGAPDTLWFTGKAGVKYEFFSQARDRALNLEDTLHVPDAVTVILVGTDDLPPATTIDVYPNPASLAVSFTIRTPSAAPCSVTLYALDGSALRQWTVLPNRTTVLPLSALPAGLYYLKAETGGHPMLIKKILHLQ